MKTLLSLFTPKWVFSLDISNSVRGMLVIKMLCVFFDTDRTDVNELSNFVRRDIITPFDPVPKTIGLIRLNEVFSYFKDVSFVSSFRDEYKIGNHSSE